MLIEKAQPQDLSEIIEVLKRSLGEGLLPKSVEYFKWKHLQNPFGSSVILLARSEGKIIGVRAFMKWTWVNSDHTITTVRAVDTATDPSHQGKGIFTKLTMEAVKNCTEQKIPFVFNSPNTMSMPGYIKMGWYENGRLPLFVQLGSLFPRFYNLQKVTEFNAKYDIRKALSQLSENWQAKLNGANYHTPIDKCYLEWRYRDCPAVQYGAVIESNQFGIIFRLKKWKSFFECRICELWVESNCKESEVLERWKRVLRDIRPLLVTCGASPGYHFSPSRPLRMFGPYKKGPMITLRTMAETNLSPFNQFSQWMPSLGSIELF